MYLWCYHLPHIPVAINFCSVSTRLALSKCISALTKDTVKSCSDSGVSLCKDACLLPGIKNPSHFSQNYDLCLAPSPYVMARTGLWEKVGIASLLLVAMVLWYPLISIKQLLCMFILMAV